MGVSQYRTGARGPAVLFVKADWCPHCQSTKPEIRRAAQIMGSVVPIYEVDSERNADVVRALGVNGFPTILFRNAAGRMTAYNGERRARDIADWACAKSGSCGR